MDSNWDRSCEPMEIDLSSNSAMEVSYTGYDRVPSPVKELDRTVLSHVYLNNSPDKELLIIGEADKMSEINDSNQNNKWFYSSINSCVIIIPIFIVLLSLVFYNTTLKCYETINLTFVKETLRSKVFGQAVAIDTFIKALEVEDNSKLVILYGGTGVGKTFTVSLLLNNIVNYTNIYHYSMPAFPQTISEEFMIGLILCKSSIIVIDDISINNIEIKSTVEELIVKSRNLHKKLTIILIYNSHNNGQMEKRCDRSFVSKLEDTFNHIPIYRSYVKFEPLSEESLVKCIQNEFGMKKLSDRDLLKVKKNFNVHLDGCKGVHQKMKYFNVV